MAGITRLTGMSKKTVITGITVMTRMTKVTVLTGMTDDCDGWNG